MKPNGIVDWLNGSRVDTGDTVNQIGLLDLIFLS